MTIKFGIDKIVKYLDRYKSDLRTLYKWNAKIDRLVELDTLNKKQVKEINALSHYEKEIQLIKTTANSAYPKVAVQRSVRHICG